METQHPQQPLHPGLSASSEARPSWAQAAERLLGLSPRLLRSDEIELARGLLYDVYYREQGWEPLQPNASGLRADHERRRFADELDFVAVWVGLFARGGELVGVTRILERAALGRLEIERYQELPPELIRDRVVVEANRVAVRGSHRGQIALALLAIYCDWIARQLGADRSIGTASSRIVRGPARAYGWRPAGLSFRYHPDDPKPVELIYYDFDARHLRILGRWLALRLRRLVRRSRRRRAGRGAG